MSIVASSDPRTFGAAFAALAFTLGMEWALGWLLTHPFVSLALLAAAALVFLARLAIMGPHAVRV